MSRVAVVIPLYNHAGFIRAALESVYHQTRPPERIIVIDDGSSDSSADQVADLSLPGLELFRQENQGAHATLNRGITLAEDCEWIAILNSDDLYTPTRLERCIEIIGQRPKTELLCTGLHQIDDDGQPLPPESPKVRRLKQIWPLVLSHPDPLVGLGISNFTKTTSNFFARRSFLLDHPFPAYRYVHDYHVALCAAFEDKLSVLPEDLLSYRVHGTNTIKSAGRKPVIAETLQMNLDLLAAYAPAMRGSAELRRRMRVYFARVFGNHTDFRGEILLQLLAEAVSSQPQLFNLESVANLTEWESPSSPLPLLPAPVPLPIRSRKKR